MPIGQLTESAGMRLSGAGIPINRQERDVISMEEVTTVISTVGFPIAMCILLFWYMKEQMKTHKEETDQLKNVINENNVILAGLKQLIEDKLNA